MGKRKYSNEIVEFVKKNIVSKRKDEIAEMVNKKFGTNYTAANIRNICNINKFKGGKVGKLKKENGSIYKNSEGYWTIKMSDNNWRRLHNIIWENHCGKIPKGYIVVFKDKNKDNLDINNLMLISQRENRILNSKCLRNNNAELTEVALLTIRLEDKIKRKE